MRANLTKTVVTVVLAGAAWIGQPASADAAKPYSGKHQLEGFHLQEPKPLTLDGKKGTAVSDTPPVPADAEAGETKRKRPVHSLDDASSMRAAMPASALSTGSAIEPPAGCTPPELANQEIAELARGLRHDPKLMYEYVRDTIQYTPKAGQYRSALATILDRRGTAYDQANLLLTLLRQACIQAELRYGLINISGDALANWLGLPNNVNAIKRKLASNGIAVGAATDGSAITRADLRHIWVVATINGQTYEIDPSFNRTRK